MPARVLFCLLLICSPVASSAVDKEVSKTAAQLTQALEQLQKTSDDPNIQERYLEAFPHTYKSFLELFEPDSPLYDGHEYLEALYSLAGRHEVDVGELLVRLSKDAHYDADAPSYLQHATTTFGGQYTKTFVVLVKKLPFDKQSNLITFLADVENHQAYPEYQLIIDHLKGLAERELAHKFEAARAKRSKQHHG